MALEFVADLPEDEVTPRSISNEVAAQLKENPTSDKWAKITQGKGYSKRGTALAEAKRINEHTHPSYRDYGFEAKVRTIKHGDGTEENHVFARYNDTLQKAGELAPEAPKRKRTKKTDTAAAAVDATAATVQDTDETTSAADAAPAAAAPQPVESVVTGNGTPRARAKAATK